MDQGLRVHALGRAEISVGEHPLAQPTSAKATALLFFLAVTGTGHSRSALAGLLWSDLPEATARANLRLVLSKLRRTLPDHLEVTRQTVALQADRPVWVDAVEVARAAAEPNGADLMSAVRLCRGELLEGFGVPGAQLFDEWLTGRRASVRADMLTLIDRAVQQAREQRDIATGIEAARRLLGLEPLYEEAHRALMWFLATGGRRSAALAQYETCRYLLREELGIEPSAATVSLRDEIASVGGFDDLGGTPALVASGGGGQAPEAAGKTSDHSLPHAELPRHSLGLVGREEELAQLHAMLDDRDCRLVTLVGPGGIGKTRLALEVAAARQDRYRDGVVFVSLVGTGPASAGEAADLLVAALARALDVAVGTPRAPIDLLAEQLAGRELLLILDNMEQLRDAASAIAELLSRTEGLQVLVTSRRQLGLGAEWLLDVPGLPYPQLGADANAADYEAVRLFEARARLVRPDFPVGDPDTGRICRLVAGVPLAIELAARWARSAHSAAIAEQLGGADGPALLTTTAADVAPRHRSLHAVVDWSYRLLADDERGALRRLSVLRGGFDLAAAAEVADAGLPLLAGLVDHSLVTVDEDGRYAMHELLRQYAAGLLAEDPAEESQTRQRHAAHYAALLPAPSETAPWTGPGLVAEAENLRAATTWFAHDADPAALDAHLLRLWALYRHMGWFRDAQAILGTALELRDDATQLQRARWRRMLGEAHRQLGEMHPARHHLARTLEGLGGRVPTSAPGGWGILAAQVAQLPQLARRVAPYRGRSYGRPGAQDRRDAARERAVAGFTLNEVHWVLGEHRPILPLSVQALHDAERSGDPDVVAQVQAGLGMTLGTIGLHRLARRHLRATGTTAARTGDPLTVCWVGILAGLYWLGVGNWAAFESDTARALELRHRTRMHRLADEVLLLSGVARYLTADYPAAAAAAAEGLAAGHERHDPAVQLWGLALLMETALRADPGNPELGTWAAEAAHLLPGSTGTNAARLHAATARLHLAAGRTADAWQAVRTADGLMGPRPSFEPYALEAHAGVTEVCLALRERSGRACGSPAEPGVPDADELRAASDADLSRLRRYARTYPIALPRALVCTGWDAWLRGRPRSAGRSWAAAIRAAARLRMPYELARAHHEFGRHLAPGQRSPMGLDRAAHLDAAANAYRSAGCVADLDRVQELRHER
ncbi:AAA family ATPase [Streptomycetaceae bacterium NBC_01309]